MPNSFAKAAGVEVYTVMTVGETRWDHGMDFAVFPAAATDDSCSPQFADFRMQRAAKGTFLS